MKSSIVPAQITTVEDRVAGSLSLKQLILLAMPVFIDFVIYFLMPGGQWLTPYKIGLMIIVALVCGLSAIRFRGKILLVWAATIARYNARPRHYIFNKNDEYLRIPEPAHAVSDQPAAEAAEPDADPHLPTLTPDEVRRLEGVLADPAANVSFIIRKKGGLHVHLTEVE